METETEVMDGHPRHLGHLFHPLYTIRTRMYTNIIYVTFFPRPREEGKKVPKVPRVSIDSFTAKNLYKSL